MKTIFMKVVILLLTVGLAACSTNTRNENTGIGAVSGAVVGGAAGSLIAHSALGVGIGAVAGALIGGFIGHNMDSSDATHLNDAMSHNAPNQPTKWKNEKTGATYKITPTSKTMSMNGNDTCRTYRATSSMNGQKQVTNGTACLQSNGTWTVMKA